MNMKFVKGLVIGGLVTTGMVMLWQNDNMFNTNKMMKKLPVYDIINKNIL